MGKFYLPAVSMHRGEMCRQVRRGALTLPHNGRVRILCLELQTNFPALILSIASLENISTQPHPRIYWHRRLGRVGADRHHSDALPDHLFRPSRDRCGRSRGGYGVVGLRFNRLPAGAVGVSGVHRCIADTFAQLP